MEKIFSKEEMKQLLNTADFLKWNIRTSFEAILNFNQIPHYDWGVLEEETKEEIYEAIEEAIYTARISKEFIKDIVELSFLNLNDEENSYNANYQWFHLSNREVVELLKKHGY